jgi:acetyl/propionyl-CoA carboxylase alpha subunit
MSNIIAAAEITNADAIPGYGFLRKLKFLKSVNTESNLLVPLRND